MIPEVRACSGYLVITAPNGRIATTPEPCLAAPDPSVLESAVQGADAVLSGLGPRP
jgi:hypothetical protein